ncbi:hypothetical protein M8J76_006562 [Diaphorina citri]|nr:hypothetical protein M8J76_006562 [Diaphorina citri]
MVQEETKINYLLDSWNDSTFDLIRKGHVLKFTSERDNTCFGDIDRKIVSLIPFHNLHDVTLNNRRTGIFRNMVVAMKDFQIIRKQ